MTDPTSLIDTLTEARHAILRFQELHGESQRIIAGLMEHRRQLRQALDEIVRLVEETEKGMPYVTTSTATTIVALKLGGYSDD